jgi:hypothetical protein
MLALSMARGVVVAAAALGQAGSLVQEAVNRVLAAPSFVANLAGIERPKKLRVAVVVLRDEEGKPLASKGDLQPILAETTRVLERAAGVTVVAAGDPVTVAEGAAPRAALEPDCPEGLWHADLGEAGSYYRRLRVSTPAGVVAGYGAPVTVFVVAEVRGRAGCSLGPLGDYVVVEPRVLRRGTLRLLAHELGHSCGLAHSHEERNLMRANAPGESLTRLQRAIFRNSRHVTSL